MKTLYALIGYALVALSVHGAEFMFLNRLGIDERQLSLMAGHYTLDEASNYYPLESRQVIALLDEVIHWQYWMDQDLAEGGRSIEGIRPLPEDFTLVLFSTESGDGSTQEMAVYDKDGLITDYVNMGYWSGWNGYSIDDDPESEAQVTWTTKFCFQDERHFIVERTETSAIWIDGNMANVKPMGQMVKSFQYMVDGAGHLTLTGITRHVEGEVIGKHYRFDDLSHITMYPTSDATRLDRLESLITSDDVAADINRAITDSDYYSDAAYQLKQAVWTLSEENPQQLFYWLYAHRNTEHLSGILRENIDSGVQYGPLLLHEANYISNPEVKAYILQLLQSQ